MCGEIEWMMWQLKPEAKVISWEVGSGDGMDPGTKLCSLGKEEELLKELIDKGIIQEVNA